MRPLFLAAIVCRAILIRATVMEARQGANSASKEGQAHASGRCYCRLTCNTETPIRTAHGAAVVG